MSAFVGMFCVPGAHQWYMPVHRRALQLQGSRLQTYDIVATLQRRQVEVQALEALRMGFQFWAVPCEMLQPDAKSRRSHTLSPENSSSSFLDLPGGLYLEVRGKL